MKRLTRTLLVAALILAVAALSAAPVGAAQGGTDRPFKASGEGTGTFEPIEECDFVIDPVRGPTLVCDQEIDLDFIGTHIGRSANTSTGFLTLYLAEPCITPGGGDGVQFESFQATTIVAANGDELTADTNTSGCGDGVTRAEPVGTYDITGGTGRFDGATGTGTLAGDAVGTSLSNEWTGTISY